MKNEKNQFQSDHEQNNNNDDEWMKHKKVHKRRLIELDARKQKQNAEAVFALAFHEKTQFMAVGCADGAVRIVNAEDKVAYYLREQGKEQLPTTSIKWRPVNEQNQKNILIVANADGSVSHWHSSTQAKLSTIKENDNQIYCCDFDRDGTRFATGGRDTNVRMYDEFTKQLIITLQSSRFRNAHGHSSRVYGMRFHPLHSDILITGGWDNTVQIWDLRAGESVRSFYGPHICGDALDVSPDGKQILTASWRPHEQLQKWDFNSGKLISNVPLEQHRGIFHKEQHSASAMLYSCAYSSDGRYYATGGVGTNQALLFNHSTDNLVEKFSFNTGVYAVMFSPDSQLLAIGGHDSTVTIVELK